MITDSKLQMSAITTIFYLLSHVRTKHNIFIRKQACNPLFCGFFLSFYRISVELVNFQWVSGQNENVDTYRFGLSNPISNVCSVHLGCIHSCILRCFFVILSLRKDGNSRSAQCHESEWYFKLSKSLVGLKIY